ncbi:MAG: ATP-binding cassette domain-containing protein [Candidatus Omnitrophota bacterium]
MEIFKIEKLTYFYPGMEQPALRNVNLSVKEGEFLFIAGPSGCGKTTLAKVFAGLIPDFYGGKIEGVVLFRGESLFARNKKDSRREIGMVFQEPEKQLITRSVEAELAFGPENLGLSVSEIKRRIAETVGFLGLEKLLERKVENLSSGEKQKTVLGSILAMGVKVIILDEPVSALDPVAAEEVFHVLKRLKDDLGYTIILIEQRSERCLDLADRVVFLEDGKIVKDSACHDFIRWAYKEKEEYLPFYTRVFKEENLDNMPLTISDARKLLVKKAALGKEAGKESENARDYFCAENKKLIEVRNVSFAYDDASSAVLENINFSVSENDFVCVLGENGAGKSTLLKLIMGFLKPFVGRVSVLGKNMFSLPGAEKARIAGYLSQNPNSYFLNDTLEKELKFTLDNLGKEDNGVIDGLLEFLRIERYRHKNPRELSVGEKTRAALALVMAGEPKILLLDEPTRGLNHSLKEDLGKRLKSFVKENRGAVVVVTQDVDFAAEFAGKIVLLFRGEVISCGNKYEVLKENLYYSSSLNKLFRGVDSDVITMGDALEWIKA